MSERCPDQRRSVVISVSADLLSADQAAAIEE
jgi:hypothetical protein